MDYELTFLLQKENKKKFDLNLSLCSWLCLTRSHGGSKNREQLVQTASRVVFFFVFIVCSIQLKTLCPTIFSFMKETPVSSNQWAHDNLGIPTIRRVLQSIRMKWKESSKEDPFSIYDVCVSNHQSEDMRIQRFCFHFIANKYNRRHLKYLAKRKRDHAEQGEDDTNSSS